MRAFFLMIMLAAMAPLAAGDEVRISCRDDRVDLDSQAFTRYELPRSPLLQDLYYDSANQYLVLKLKHDYHHFCEVPADVVTGLAASDHIDGFYNRNIKGKYSCESCELPQY
jgi:hypothetical protein